jgi:hypothetical protein
MMAGQPPRWSTSSVRLSANDATKAVSDLQIQLEPSATSVKTRLECQVGGSERHSHPLPHLPRHHADKPARRPLGRPLTGRPDP